MVLKIVCTSAEMTLTEMSLSVRTMSFRRPGRSVVTAIWKAIQGLDLCLFTEPSTEKSTVSVLFDSSMYSDQESKVIGDEVQKSTQLHARTWKEHG